MTVQPPETGRAPAARVLAPVRAAAALVDAAARRLGRAAGGAGAADRGSRRHAAAGHARHRARARGRPLRRRRDRRRRALPRAHAPSSRRSTSSTSSRWRRPRRGARTSSPASASGAQGVSMFVTHYATTEPPRFEGGRRARSPRGRRRSVERLLRIGCDVGARRGSPSTTRRCSSSARPWPTLVARPTGNHTLKVIGFQPYELADGGPAQLGRRSRTTSSRANLEHLRRYAPNLTDDTILATLVEEPGRPRGAERAQLARLLPRRRHEPGAVGRAAAGAGLGGAPPADRRALPDGLDHASGRLRSPPRPGGTRRS